MQAISKGKFKTIVSPPSGATEQDLVKKANKYIKGKYKIVNREEH
jgi:hypothetical protein